MIASQNAEDNTVHISADANIYAGLFDQTQSDELMLNPARKAYVHLIRGSLDINGQTIHGGDALLVQDEALLTLSNGKEAEVLVFDLAP